MGKEQKKNKVPKCIGVIMDGNRRWAKEEGIAIFKGYSAGYEKLKEFIKWAKEAGVRNLIFFAFSTENWNRSKKEVAYLMDLFEKALVGELDEVKKENVRMKYIGQKERFSDKFQGMMKKTEEDTKNNPEGTIVLALSYCGRLDILSAVNYAINAGNKNITEEEFSKMLWTKDIPDPDIIIRTSGEKRLSGFLPWQGVYSELFFIDTYWPAFSKEEFLNILEEYSNRERRRGK